MDTVIVVLVLLLAVSLSGFCLCVIPKAITVRPPLPVIQIILGACLSVPALKLDVEFNPSVFIGLFIPPLLFADGWRIPKREFFKAHRAILMLALGLVFATVVGLGYFLHFLVPLMPLPVAFALAAVLAPTDAVAFSAIVGRNRVPEELVHILNGEALMNDASGLIAFKFAVAAAATGVFSLGSASVTFVLVAVGGLATGAALSWLTIQLTVRVFMLSANDDPGGGVMLTLLIPFAAYLVAEQLTFSGVLSAVAAGMVMNHQTLRAHIPTLIRVRMKSTWSMVEFVFNGMVFVLLGLQSPRIVGRALVQAHHDSFGKVVLLLSYIIAVTVALYGLRLAWIWASNWILTGHLSGPGVQNTRLRARTIALMTVGGVRGAVTLAGVLALPVVLPSGTLLAGRDLAIFIASGTILVSLLAAVIAIPILLQGRSDVRDPYEAEEQLARRTATRAAIRAVSNVYEDLATELEAGACTRCADANARVMNHYQERLEVLGDDEPPRLAAKQSEQLEARLRVAAFQAERNELLSLRHAGEINDETLNKLLHEIDMSEAAIIARTTGAAA